MSSNTSHVYVVPSAEEYKAHAWKAFERLVLDDSPFHSKREHWAWIECCYDNRPEDEVAKMKAFAEKHLGPRK